MANDIYYGTCDTTTTAIDSSSWCNIDSDLKKSRTLISEFKNGVRTEFIKNFQDIIKELKLHDRAISIAAFTKYRSDVEKDLNMLQNIIPCYVYLIHPIESDPQYDPVNLFSYNLAMILDVLEYAPSTMARANIVKEALTSLRQENPAYLIIRAKSEEEAQETALSEDDLISLALYAGATKTWKLGYMKEAKFPLIVASNGG